MKENSKIPSIKHNWICYPSLLANQPYNQFANTHSIEYEYNKEVHILHWSTMAKKKPISPWVWDAASIKLANPNLSMQATGCSTKKKYHNRTLQMAIFHYFKDMQPTGHPSIVEKSTTAFSTCRCKSRGLLDNFHDNVSCDLLHFHGFDGCLLHAQLDKEKETQFQSSSYVRATCSVLNCNRKWCNFCSNRK